MNIDPVYYGHIAQRMRQVMANDPREPKDWDDSDKLELLAALFDEADLAKGVDNREVQDDLRRIADELRYAGIERDLSE